MIRSNETTGHNGAFPKSLLMLRTENPVVIINIPGSIAYPKL